MRLQESDSVNNERSMNSDSTLIRRGHNIAIALIHHYQGGSEAGLSDALSSLNIGSNQSKSNDEEKEATDDINTAIICANCGKEGAEDDMSSCKINVI